MTSVCSKESKTLVPKSRQVMLYHTHLVELVFMSQEYDTGSINDLDLQAKHMKTKITVEI